MFVELKVGPDITPIEQDLPTMEAPDGESLAAVSAQRLAPPAWSLGKLPPGFQLNVHRRRALADSQGDMEHFIFSDGLASVSVYIQPHADEEWLSGESTIGAAGAVGRMVGDYQVVVVGEVPPKTLHWFARQVQAATP
jgi:sigma-E factor negative regulatory protein RseB